MLGEPDPNKAVEIDFWERVARPDFAREVDVSPEIQRAVEENQRRQREAGKTSIDIAGL